MNALRCRVWCAVAVALLLGVPFLPVAAQDKSAGRDWKKYPVIVEVDTPNDVYAFGDVHGDYERLVAVLMAAKIIPADPGPPEKVQWQAGNAVLVCTGDFIDKWTQSLRVIALLRSLQEQAAKAGGQFVITLGNHEAEFLANSRNKKAIQFIKELEAKGVKPEEVAAGTDSAGIGAWLRTLPVAARVNDWFFAHAGNTHQRSLAKLRDDLQAGLEKQGYKTAALQDPNSVLLARMNPAPWWEMPGDTGAQSKEKLAKCVYALGVKHLVIGHAPAEITFADKTTRPKGELFQHFDGLIFLIDVGMSHAVAYSTGAVLHIRQNGKSVQAFRIPASGKAVEIWKN
jgi:hypothetical protein